MEMNVHAASFTSSSAEDRMPMPAPPIGTRQTLLQGIGATTRTSA